MREQRVLIQEPGAKKDRRAERVEHGEPERFPFIAQASSQKEEHTNCGGRSDGRHQADVHAGSREAELDVESARTRFVHEAIAQRTRIVVDSGWLGRRELRFETQQSINEWTGYRVRHRRHEDAPGLLLM